jgi:hypothetical protein
MTAAANWKCSECGLVNYASVEVCRRCRNAFTDELAPAVALEVEVPQGHAHRIAKRAICLTLVVVAVVFGWSRSLLLTSDPIDDHQREVVFRSIQILDRAGFSRESAMLRHFANFRATDNWWNLYLGHQDAYAATNFPLGVLTLYEPFFRTTVDDNERAVILLHEAQHLVGAGEEAALDRVWREKHRLGWTTEEYSQTKVWKNTREWTQSSVPSLFACGPNHLSDCTP